MSPIIINEIRNALWGCVEIPLYLKKGATRFSGTLAALKRSFLIPIILIPIIIYTIPSTGVYEGKSFDWQASLMLIQIILGTGVFAAIIYFFKAKHVTADDLRKCLTGYNWLSLSAYVVNIPLILLAVFGINTWDDVFAMMILVTLYSYSFLAYMIARILKIHIFLGVGFALADLMMGEIIRNLTTYFMLHHF
jgi:hypothetical protein